MRRLDIPPAPFLIAFILGPLLEDNFRQSLLLSRGDWSIFVSSPICWLFWDIDSGHAGVSWPADICAPPERGPVTALAVSRRHPAAERIRTWTASLSASSRIPTLEIQGATCRRRFPSMTRRMTERGAPSRSWPPANPDFVIHLGDVVHPLPHMRVLRSRGARCPRDSAAAETEPAFCPGEPRHRRQTADRFPRRGGQRCHDLSLQRTAFGEHFLFVSPQRARRLSA